MKKTYSDIFLDLKVNLVQTLKTNLVQNELSEYSAGPQKKKLQTGSYMSHSSNLTFGGSIATCCIVWRSINMQSYFHHVCNLITGLVAVSPWNAQKSMDDSGDQHTITA